MRNEKVSSVVVKGSNECNYPRHIIVNGGRYYPVPRKMTIKEVKCGAALSIRYTHSDGRPGSESYNVRTVSEFEAIYRMFIESMDRRFGLQYMRVTSPVTFFRHYDSLEDMLTVSEGLGRIHWCKEDVRRVGDSVRDPLVLTVRDKGRVRYLPIPVGIKLTVTPSGGLRITDGQVRFKVDADVSSVVYDEIQLMVYWKLLMRAAKDYLGMLMFNDTARPVGYFKLYDTLDFLTKDQRDYYHKSVSGNL